MKKSLVILLLLFASTGFSQTSNYKNILISGKWTPTYMMRGEQKNLIPKHKENKMWVFFFKDGKYEANSIVKQDNIIESENDKGIAKEEKIKKEYGKWMFSKDNTSITIDFNDRKDTVTIESLTTSELILSKIEQGSKQIIGFKNIK